MNTKCSIPDCNNASRARGWCGKHYQRWKKYGDVNHEVIVKTTSLEEALELKTSWDENGCWLWHASKTVDGYATYGGHESKEFGTRTLSRIMWMRHTGKPIPEGLEIDHLCYVRNCINLEHLRLATREMQVRNLEGLKKNNKSGVRGVYWLAREQRWLAQVKHKGQTHFLGRFNDPKDAIPLLEAKRKELYGKDYAG